MGWKKEKRPLLLMEELDSDGGITEPVQQLTGKTTGTALTNYGVTRIHIASTTESATAAELVYKLPEPVAGRRKVIIADGDAGSTKTIQIRSHSSTCFIYGTTMNAFRISTGSTAHASYIELIGLATNSWGVVSLGSTSIALLASTA